MAGDPNSKSDDGSAPEAAQAASPVAPALEDGNNEPTRRARSVSEEGEVANTHTDVSAPLPDEAIPGDDGWTSFYEPNVGTWYFYNRFTNKTQWENPRVPGASQQVASYARFAPN